MKIYICDDMIEMVEAVKAECEHYLEAKNIKAQVAGDVFFPDELEEEDKRPDILLLDIDMPTSSGIEIKDRMEKYDDGPFIIFITSHDEMVYEAFGKNVIGFLRKPVDRVLFEKVMDKAVDFYESRFLSVQLPGGIELMCRDIIAIKSEHVYSTIVLADGELSIRRSLKEWETLLPEKDFLRINEKWIIHYAYVDKIKDDKVTLKNGERLAVSRRRKLQLRDGYISYCLRKGRYR